MVQDFLHQPIYYTVVHFYGSVIFNGCYTFIDQLIDCGGSVSYYTSVHFHGSVLFNGFSNFIDQLINFGGTIFFSWTRHRSMVHPS